MKKALIILSVIAALSACTGNQEQLQKVSVEGNRFVTEDGNTIVFNGLCLSDPVKMIADGQWSEEVFAQAEEWGANIVRFAIHPQHLRNYGWEETFEAIDQGIEWATEHNLYVILDWHSIGTLNAEMYQADMYYTTKEETYTFWAKAAARYKGNNTVALYEIFNEPTYTVENAGMPEVSWAEWKALQETIIDVIREIDPSAVCLCAGFNWAYDLTAAGADPINRENIAYVCHPYPMKVDAPWEEKWESDWGFMSENYPVVCTEIGYCLENEKGAHIPVISTDEYGTAITNYLASKGISFTVWCFDPDWGPMLISDWDYTPTTQGRFFKNYLQTRPRNN